MVQVTPFQGSKLAETVLMGENIRQNQRQNRLQDMANTRQERALSLRERQFEASQRPEPFNPQELTLGTLERVSGLNIDPERKAEIFKRTMTQQLLRGVQQGQIEQDQAEAVAQGLMNVTAEDFQGNPVDKFNAEFRSFREKVRLLEDPNTSDAEKRAIRIDLGMAPRAVGDANVTLAGGEDATAGDVARVEGERAAGREAGQQSVEISGEMFSQLSTVKGNIRLYDEAIEAVDQGANSGAIASRFPSITASSVRLDNIQQQLGLNVLSMASFGALSEGELRLALTTALPTNLDGPELKKWLQDKKAAEQKLATELEESARFLAKSENTLSDLLERKASGSADLSTMTDEELERLANGG